MAEENSVDFMNLFTQELGVPEVSGEESKKSENIQEPEDQDPEEKKDEGLSVEEAFEAQNREKEEQEKQQAHQKDIPKPKKKETSEPPVSGSEDTEDIQSSPTLLFARFLSEQGHLTSFNEEEFTQLAEEHGEEEALASLWNKEAQVIRDEIIDTYDADVAEFLALRDGGVDSKEAFDLVSGESFINNLKTEDLEDEDKEELRRQLITQKYKLTTKFSNEKIKKLVDRAFSLGEDIEEATESVDDIKEYYKEAKKAKLGEVEKDKQALERQKEESLKALKTKVDELKEVIPGVPLTSTGRKKLIEKITKPVGEINGQPINALWQKRLKDPLTFDIILAELDEAGVFDGKWDKVVKKVKTNTVNKLKEALKAEETRTRTGALQTYEDASTQAALTAMKSSNAF